MAIETPSTSTQVENRIKTDVQRAAPDSNPFLTVHWLSSLIVGIGRRIFDFYRDLARTEKRLFPDTADSENASKWGGIYVGSKNSATPAAGFVVASGVVASNIPIATTMTANGNIYETTQAGQITAVVAQVSSATFAGGLVTIVTNAAHGLASLIPVTIAGANETDYNVTNAAITIISENSFSYEIDTTPAATATGTITAAYSAANIPIQSQGFGAGANLSQDTPLSLDSPIAGVGDTLYVDANGVSGGQDIESNIDYKARYLDKIRNPVANFNVSAIKAKAKEVNGVTRVFVQSSGDVVGSSAIDSITRSGNIALATVSAGHNLADGQIVTITGAVQNEYNVTDSRIIVESETVFYYLVLGSPVSPATGTIQASVSVPPGQTVVYFMRDNDDNPIPDANEVAAVQAKIFEILPVNTSESDASILAPVGVSQDYVFTELLPNSASMQAAVAANIAQFHDEQTFIGQNVDEDAYRAAIKNTIDPETGEVVKSFALSSPSGDIAVSTGQISTAGNVSF